MATVLISGGTGLVGKSLCKRLKEKGYQVAILSRENNRDSDIPTYAWNIEKGTIEKGAIEAADYVIHLAGANIGDKRWTAKRKQLIIDSRVNAANLLFDKIKESKVKPKVFISASATGYYGTITTDKIYSETDLPSDDFLGKTCQLWEQSADQFGGLGIRTVKIRTGIVLTKQGGALAKMISPVIMGIGSAIGKGRQYLPWIHIDDLCNIYIKALEDNQMNGAYNAIAPDYRTYTDFASTLARILHKPFWFPNIPAIAIKILFGKMSEILLKGSRVSSEKIKAAGYNFLFPNLESALKNLLVNKRAETEDQIFDSQK